MLVLIQFIHVDSRNRQTHRQASQGCLLSTHLLYNFVVFALVVDDCTCRLWDVEAGTQQVMMKLKSPGMSVCWHPSDPMKVSVNHRCMDTDKQMDR